MCPIGPNDVAKQYSMCMTISILLKNVLVICHIVVYCLLRLSISNIAVVFLIVIAIIIFVIYRYHPCHYKYKLLSLALLPLFFSIRSPKNWAWFDYPGSQWLTISLGTR